VASLGLAFLSSSGIVDIAQPLIERLAESSGGLVRLSVVDDDRLTWVAKAEGGGEPRDYGPKAPTTVKALLGYLHAARIRGYAMIDEVFALGMAAVAAPVQRGERPAIGVISIAGPRGRMTTENMQAMVPDLLAMTRDLAATSSASGLFSRPPLGKA
jgi:IclR family acetate operon transcriptional repressor